jgi:hypothetical protein
MRRSSILAPFFYAETMKISSKIAEFFHAESSVNLLWKTNSADSNEKNNSIHITNTIKIVDGNGCY